MRKPYEKAFFMERSGRMRQFYLHSRKGMIYVQFVDQATKKCLSALSTGKTNRDEALIIVYEWLKNGIPKKELSKPRPVIEELTISQILTALKNVALTSQDLDKMEKILKDQGVIAAIVKKNSPSSQLFVDFLDKFWDYEKSPYIEEKNSHKKKVTRGYVTLFHNRFASYWKPYFEGRILESITKQDLKKFAIHVAKTNEHLSSQTLKHILQVGVYALQWAYANEVISTNPTIGLLKEYAASDHKDRGVLTPEEATKLFSMKWKNELCFFVNILAMTTGMRVGEILALKMENIGEEYIHVEHSYSMTDGLKGTKTKKARVIPILPGVRDALRQIGSKNPHGNGFIFYTTTPDAPMKSSSPLTNLKHMLIKMRIGDKMAEFELKKGDSKEERARKKEDKSKEVAEAKAYWKERNVIFHSWRHFYAARMTDKLEARKVMLATGHKTEAVFKKYSDHGLESDLVEVAETSGKLFGVLLPESLSVESKKDT
jgi:integrase